MRLVRLGHGNWTVFALCSSEQSCPVLDFVDGLESKRGAKVLADLKEFVPTTMPKDWVRTEFSEKLRDGDGLHEFRWPTKGGGTPRVLWFYDENRVVVCTSGVDKKGKLRTEDLDYAKRLKTEYFEAKKKNQLVVVDVEDFG